jgi:hypothetical protein
MKEKMKKRILALIVVLALVGALVPAILFAAEDTVTCTVSAYLVSVTVSDGDVAYGALEVGTSKSTLVAGLNDQQTATNDGTVTEDFSIKSSDATRGGGTNWTLVTGTPGFNEFKHEFSTDSSFPGTALTNSYTSLATSVATSGSEDFDLQITMPGSTDDYLEHTITVTVLATQS